MFESITDEDVPAVVTLINRAYRGSGSSASWNTETAHLAGDRTTADLLRADMRAKPKAAMLKWTERFGGTVAGCVWLEPLDERTWYLGSLAADPERQNAGLGRTMLAAAEEWVRVHGGLHIRITVVNVRDTLIAWYLRRGYRLTGEIEAFPYGDDRFGTPLRNDLAFVVLVKDLVSLNAE